MTTIVMMLILCHYRITLIDIPENVHVQAPHDLATYCLGIIKDSVGGLISCTIHQVNDILCQRPFYPRVMRIT